MAKVSPFSAGMNCRCPECGEGQVFRGYLTMNDECAACGADFSVADSGDGPAFFVMWIAMIVIVPLGMLFHLWVDPPVWVHLLIFPPVIILFCLWLLRPAKSLLFALQWANKAEEARFEDHADQQK